jgi:hypothetical protein
MGYFEHVLVALTVQTLVGRITGNWWAGAALASAYFIGRELAQAEYRWIERFGEGLRTNMPWWGPFDRRVWTTLDQWVDWLGPLVATCSLAWYMSRR